MKTCEIHIEADGKNPGHERPCSRRAKFMAPDPIFNKKAKCVCGIHRRSIDIMLERCGYSERCIPIEED